MDTNILIGVAGLVLAAISIEYARKTYKKEHIDTPNENMLHLKAQFKATQQLSKDLYSELNDFAIKKNYLDEYMWPSVTYRMYLQELEILFSTGDLSDKLYDSVFNSDLQQLPEMTIQSMSKSLQDQFNALMLIRNEVKMKARN